MESLVARHPIYMEILAKVLHNLYDRDVLSDESIISWHKKLLSAGPNEQPQATICSKIKPLIAWLEQSESESENDSD
jgi:translation initiation factor eIF-2B subunit epsilon